MINAEVDRVWAEYDKDNNGYLQKDEAIVFIKAMMGNVGCEYNQDEFDECFKEMDTDNNNYVERKEMTKFITALIGLEK